MVEEDPGSDPGDPERATGAVGRYRSLVCSGDGKPQGRLIVTLGLFRGARLFGCLVELLWRQGMAEGDDAASISSRKPLEGSAAGLVRRNWDAIAWMWVWTNLEKAKELFSASVIEQGTNAVLGVSLGLTVILGLATVLSFIKLARVRRFAANSEV